MTTEKRGRGRPKKDPDLLLTGKLETKVREDEEQRFRALCAVRETDVSSALREFVRSQLREATASTP